MKRFFLFLFAFASVLLSAQNDGYVYQNDFSDPYLFFSDVNEDNGKIYTRNGKYHMEYYDSIGTWRQTKKNIL